MERAHTSSTAVSEAIHDWLSCWERKYASTGYERWLSINSAAHVSQCASTSVRASKSQVAGPVLRRKSSYAVGGDPARASSREIVTSRRENDWYRTGR